MRLNARMFTVAAAALAGLAVFILFAGSEEADENTLAGFPRFQTIGENRILNIFRRNKIPVNRPGHSYRSFSRSGTSGS